MEGVYIIEETSGCDEESRSDVLYYGLSFEECEAWITSRLPDVPAKIYFERKAGNYSWRNNWYYIIREVERVPQ